MIRPEARMKAAVIERLFESRHIDSDAVLISEMTIANWSRRADIVLANGKLWAFEIKSERDNLTRLPGQLKSFAFHFEKFVVVIASRFEKRVREVLPPNVGLWVEDQSGALIERVRPKSMPIAKEASIALMTAVELRALLTCNGLANLKGASRQKLEELALNLPAKDLATATRSAIKQRHRKRHVAFVEQRAALDTNRAMSVLQKFVKRNDDIPIRSYEKVLPSICISDSHPLLVRAPAGVVLKRRTT